MPNYTFKCIDEECGFEYSAFCSYSDSQKPQSCPNCDGAARKVLGAGQAIHVKDVIDNGLVTKRIEQPSNIREMLEDRNDSLKKD
jgi:putative FmdB family regulatory protein